MPVTGPWVRQANGKPRIPLGVLIPQYVEKFAIEAMASSRSKVSDLGKKESNGK